MRYKLIINVTIREDFYEEDKKKYHVVFNKRSLPDFVTSFSKIPEQTNRRETGYESKLYLLFLGFQEKDADMIKSFAYNFYNKLYITDYNPKWEVVLSQKKGGKNVARSKKGS